MDYFAQQLINGIVLGSIYGLIAIGYTMVYGIVGMINFAHGDIFMIGGFIALITFLILVSFGLTAIPLILLIVLLVSMAITALYGWTVERIAYRPLRHSFRLAPMLSAIGMSFVLTNYSQVAQGARVKPVPPIITGGYMLHEGATVSWCSCPTSRSSSSSPPSCCWRSSPGWWRAPGSAATCAPASRTRPWRRCSASMSTAPSP